MSWLQFVPENNIFSSNLLGGWLLVANLVLESSSPPSSWTPSASTYTEISNYDKNRLGITVSAMNQLRIHAQYTQHEIMNLRLFMLCVKIRKYETFSIRSNSAMRNGP